MKMISHQQSLSGFPTSPSGTDSFFCETRCAHSLEILGSLGAAIDTPRISAKNRCRTDDCMNVKEISKAKNMVPFRPFVMHLTSGKDLLIRHADQFAIKAKDNFVFVFGEDDAYHLITADQIASIVVLPTKRIS